jgi:hypothetical protein
MNVKNILVLGLGPGRVLVSGKFAGEAYVLEVQPRTNHSPALPDMTPTTKEEKREEDFRVRLGA